LQNTPELTKDIESQVRAMQIQSIVRLTPLTAFVNTLNVIVICSIFWHFESHITLLVWESVIIILYFSASLS
jgi:hypothetical protein